MQEVANRKLYIFSGRVHPERYNWGISPMREVVVLHNDGARSLIRLSLTASQLTAIVETDADETVLDMKNRVSSESRNVADALGHVCAAAVDVEIISCITPGGDHLVFNTGFDGLFTD